MPVSAPRPPGPMRLVAITRILDEADIVEAFVRHTAAYADHHVFLDNGSRDGTLDILRSLKDEGFGITVFRNVSVSFNEVATNTAMFRYAARDCHADWVLVLDTDEFIDDRTVEGGLVSALEREIQEHADCFCIKVPLIEYEMAPDDDPEDVVPPRRLRRRHNTPVTTKVFVRSNLATPDTTIDAGNHDVFHKNDHVLYGSVPGLKLAHYPRRSPYQTAAKCAKGWAKVLAAGQGEVDKGRSLHYKGTFDLVLDQPASYFRNQDFMKPPEAHRALTLDPITYRGGDLRYSTKTDEPIRAIRGMMGYLDELARRHGRLIEEVPEARARIEAWDKVFEPLL